MAKRGLNGTATIDSAEASPSPAPAPSPAPDWLQWAQQHLAKIVFFRRLDGQPRVRVSLDGGISFEGETLDEACRECAERLDRRRERAPRAVRVYRG